MMLPGKILLGSLGTVALAGMLAYSEGAVIVSVSEHGPDGDHLNLFLPAAPMPLAMKCIPENHYPQLPPEARAALPGVVAAAYHLKRVPDFVLAEIEDAPEQVRIEKRGRKLIVEVQSPDESVYVEIPLRTIARAVRELEAAQRGRD